MSFKDYVKRKNEVMELLESIIELQLEDGVTKVVNQKLENIRSDRFIISIFGHFSNGKSTFLNALMGFGDEVLKEDELPTTATITKLRAPESEEMLNKAEVVFNNGIKKLIDIKNLGRYSASSKDYDVEGEIKEVILFLDSEFLKNGVEIVDTPGFNSPIAVHTETARSHVDKSDASIYLFSYDKPGSDQEFKFLNYVNKYMNRIFFVLNKIDLCDTTENTVEGTIEQLRVKLEKKNVIIEGKEIYPLSALRAKQGIKEESKDKKRVSRFNIFEEALANYLTSDENLKDRLYEPLYAVENKLNMELEGLNERILTCNKDNAEIIKEIEKKKELIRDCEEEIKEKRINIKNSVRNIIRNSKTDFQSISLKIIDEVKDELSGINSEFDVALADFSSMTIGVYDKFLRHWDIIRNSLEDEFCTIIEENIDDDRKLEQIEGKLVNDIIHRSLDIERIELSDPTFDFKELDKLDKEIQKRKNEYDKNREKIARCRNDKQKLDMLMEEKDNLKSDINKLIETKDMRLECIGEARAEYGTRTVDKERKRKGLFGSLGNVLFGPKVVSQTESYVDYSTVEFVEKQREKIRNEYSVNISGQEKKLENKLYEIMDMGDVDYKLNDLELESKDSRRKYIDYQNMIEDEKRKISKKIIRVSRDNYFKEIKSVCNEYILTINRFLDSQRNLITSIIEDAIKDDMYKIDDMKENLYTITTLANKTPDELQQELQSLYKSVKKIESAIDSLKDFKEMEKCN